MQPYDPWANEGLPWLNVGDVRSGTRTLGPGVRGALWVQGCGLRCPGCIAPELIPMRPARLATPAELVAELLRDPTVTGLTFSGGEPMLQAAGLAEVARLARAARPLDILCFTGLTLERLRTRPPGPCVAALLAQLDLLIDGPYVEAANDGQGLRGSSNQRFHYLTDRLRTAAPEIERGARHIEIVVRTDDVVLYGVPAPDVLRAFRSAFPETPPVPPTRQEEATP